MKSDYMHWAKTQPHLACNLATSGLMDYPLSGLTLSLSDLEITGNDYYGYPPLLEAIAAKHNVPPENVFTTLGTSMANHMAFAALVQSGDEVLIEHPTYELLLSTARYIGARVRRFSRRPQDAFRIVPGEIAKSVTRKTKLIVLTNLHNPSSAYTDERTLLEVASVARSIGAKVLVDEVYLDAAFGLAPRSAVHLGREFISTNSLTKVYGLSGLRCGWVLAEPQVVRTMWRLNDLFAVNLAHPAERLSVIAFRQLPAIAEWSRSILTANRQLFRAFLAETHEYLEAGDQEYGTVAFPRLKRASVAGLCSLLREKYQTSVVPGRFFEMPGHFRIGLGGPPTTTEQGLANLRMALAERTTARRKLQ